jgi:hypothetical protein
VVEGYTERRILEKFYAVGLRTEPALIVRGSSRRITIMRFRPANIRVINRRENYLNHDLRCLLRAKRKKQLLVVDGSFQFAVSLTFWAVERTSEKEPREATFPYSKCGPELFRPTKLCSARERPNTAVF